MSIENELLSLIKQNLPESTAGAMREYLEEMKKLKSDNEKLKDSNQQLTDRLKQTCDKLDDLRDKISDAEEVLAREVEVSKKEVDLRVMEERYKCSDEKVQFVERIAGLVFRNPMVRKISSRDVPVPHGATMNSAGWTDIRPCRDDIVEETI